MGWSVQHYVHTHLTTERYQNVSWPLGDPWSSTQAKIMCSSTCKCVGCRNYEDSPARRTVVWDSPDTTFYKKANCHKNKWATVLLVKPGWMQSRVDYRMKDSVLLLLQTQINSSKTTIANRCFFLAVCVFVCDVFVCVLIGVLCRASRSMLWKPHAAVCWPRLRRQRRSCTLWLKLRESSWKSSASVWHK